MHPRRRFPSKGELLLPSSPNILRAFARAGLGTTDRLFYLRQIPFRLLIGGPWSPNLRFFLICDPGLLTARRPCLDNLRFPFIPLVSDGTLFELFLEAVDLFSGSVFPGPVYCIFSSRSRATFTF